MQVLPSQKSHLEKAKLKLRERYQEHQQEKDDRKINVLEALPIVSNIEPIRPDMTSIEPKKNLEILIEKKSKSSSSPSKENVKDGKVETVKMKRSAVSQKERLEKVMKNLKQGNKSFKSRR
jgi:hypothetical protein